MKLKSLLTIVSCAAISVSITVPSIAEILEDSKITSQSSGIQNKDYRNKQSISSIVGGWKALVNEIVNIYFNVRSDGRYDSIFQFNGESRSRSGTWEYSNNVLTTWTEDRKFEGQGTIKWISNDEFILTIVDNGDPYYEGVQRRYYRQSVQTSQQNGQQDKYGAFAVHGYGSYFGAAWNHSSPEAASNAAMKACFESSTAAGVDELSAQHKALDVCGSDFCRIKKVICNN